MKRVTFKNNNGSNTQDPRATTTGAAQLIFRAIFGIAIALGIASCTAATIESPATTNEAAEAHGYLVVNYTIHDQETFQKYMEAAGTLAPKYNGKVIIFDVNSRTLEGNPEKVFGVAEFPSVAEAERFYNSPEYTAARQFRIASTEGWVLLASSVPPATNATLSTTDSTQPHGYQVVNYTINDQATFQKYMDAAGPLAPQFNGSVPIFDLNTRALEGNPKKVFGIAEFPSVAEAERFYISPEYTAARQFRIASTEGSVLLASSVPPQQ